MILSLPRAWKRRFPASWDGRDLTRRLPPTSGHRIAGRRLRGWFGGTDAGSEGANGFGLVGGHWAKRSWASQGSDLRG